MTSARRAVMVALVLMGWAGSLTPAQAQSGGLSVLIKIADEPSIGGTAIGSATGTIDGTPFAVADASWSTTHSQKAPLFEGGVAIGAARNVDIIAFVDYGHARASSTQAGQIGGVPVTLKLDDYNFWGLEGGAHLRRESGVGPYVSLSAGFRRISQIQAIATTITLTRSVPVYEASVVPVFAFGGGWLFGDKAFAMGVEVAVRYAGAPSQGTGTNPLPTTPITGSVTPGAGAGSRWSLPVGVIFKF